MLHFTSCSDKRKHCNQNFLKFQVFGVFFFFTHLRDQKFPPKLCIKMSMYLSVVIVPTKFFWSNLLNCTKFFMNVSGFQQVFLEFGNIQPEGVVVTIMFVPFSFKMLEKCMMLFIKLNKNIKYKFMAMSSKPALSFKISC